MDVVADHSLESLRRHLAPIFEHSKVLKAIVFGSHARNTHDSKSDLDLILVMDTDRRFLKRHEEVEALFEALPGTNVDALIYTPEEIMNISHRPFIQKAFAEGIVIYER